MAQTNKQLTPEQMLRQDIGAYWQSPLKYVMYNYPWGVEGTPLSNHKGPRAWQKRFLIRLGELIKDRNYQGVGSVLPIRMTRVTGHGTGKSTLCAWINQFLIDTRPNCKGTVTANTSSQLRTKTWAELSKWHSMSLTKHWTEYTNSHSSMTLASKSNPINWRINAITCDRGNAEAFAGQHAEGSTSFYLFDEASAVPDELHETAEGGLVDGEGIIITFGNGTRNSGKFYDSHLGKNKNYWDHESIDSRDVEGSNTALFDQWADQYGVDSDFYKVRVRGMFPSAATTQFIGVDIVRGAQQRAVVSQRGMPLLMGVDVARFGDDKSVIRLRHGRDARTWPKREFRGIDTVKLVNHIIEYRNEIIAQGLSLDAIFVDGGGVGGPVIDMLKARNIPDIYDVQFGANAQDEKVYENKRAEIYGLLRDWLKVGCIDPKDQELETDLISVEYGFSRKRQRILLEAKEDIKARGLSSPDDSDALAVTFAEPILPKAGRDYPSDYDKPVNYDPFSQL